MMEKSIVRISNLPTQSSNAGAHVVSTLGLKGYRQIVFSDGSLGIVRDDIKSSVDEIHYVSRKNILLNYVKIISFIITKRVDIVSIHNYKYILLRLFFPFKIMTYHFHGLDKELLSFWMIRKLILDRFNEVFSVFDLAYERAIIIPNFIPNNVKPRPSSDQSNRLIFVGRIDENKNLELLLDFVNLRQEVYDLQLSVYGEGPERFKLSSRFEGPSIKFFGHVEHDVVMNALSNNDILVLPSYDEGDPKVVKEALCSGLKVVVRSTMRHIGYHENLYFLEMHSVEVFSEGMDRVIRASYTSNQKNNFITLEQARADYQRAYDGLFKF